MTNSFRPDAVTSLLAKGEVQTVVNTEGQRADGQRAKATLGLHVVVGDGMVVKAGHMNQGDLQTGVTAGGVRALIVARKPGNAGGAKGRRKVDA